MPAVVRRFRAGGDGQNHVHSAGAAGEGIHKSAIENEPIIWFAKGVKCGNVSISNLHRTEYAETNAPTIRIDEAAEIENLVLNNITQRFENSPEQPAIVNNGTIKNL